MYVKKICNLHFFYFGVCLYSVLLKEPENMIPQVTRRQIGKVNVIDINGPITGLWKTRLETQLERAFYKVDGKAAVLNFRHITDIDSLGLRSLLDATSNQKQVRILSGESEIMDFLNRYAESKRFQILNNEEELVQVYGPDLLQDVTSDDENRGSVRLQTAISIRFSYDQDSEKKQCVGVISNLSRNGFYIEYIDILSVEQTLSQLNPRDIQALDFIISLPKGKTVSGQGKVLHWQLDHDQFGIGVRIQKFDEESEKRFLHFLQSQQEPFTHRKEGR